MHKLMYGQQGFDSSNYQSGHPLRIVMRMNQTLLEMFIINAQNHKCLNLWSRSASKNLKGIQQGSKRLSLKSGLIFANYKIYLGVHKLDIGKYTKYLH